MLVVFLKFDFEGVLLFCVDDNGVVRFYKRLGVVKDGILELKGEGGLGLDIGWEKG